MREKVVMEFDVNDLEIIGGVEGIKSAVDNFIRNRPGIGHYGVWPRELHYRGEVVNMEKEHQSLICDDDSLEMVFYADSPRREKIVWKFDSKAEMGAVMAKIYIGKLKGHDRVHLDTAYGQTYF